MGKKGEEQTYDVFGFEVSVDYLVTVQVVDRKYDFGGIKLGDRTREPLLRISTRLITSNTTHPRLAKKRKQFSTGYEIHNHEQVVHVLERAP